MEKVTFRQRGFFLFIKKNYFFTHNGKSCGFSFSIGLHLDDKKVLDYIVQELGIGNVNIYLNSVRLVISKVQDIQTLIEVLTNFPLKSIQYLDYLELSQACPPKDFVSEAMLRCIFMNIKINKKNIFFL